MTRLALAVVATAALAGCGRHDDGERRLARNETLARVTATATAEARPDEARFAVGVSSIAAGAEAATAANAAKMSAVVARLRALGIAEKDLQTSQLTVNRIDYGANRGRFEVNNVVTARLRDTSKASAAIAAATAAGANVLSGPDFRVGDPEAATRRAYAAAYRSARARADAYAGAAGLSVARVLTIADGIGAAQPLMAEETSRVMAPQAVVAPPVLPGTSSATVSVTVDFALTPRPK